MAVLAGLGVAVNNLDRSTLSVALPFMHRDLHIPPFIEGLVLGWFFLVYALCLLPAGTLVDRFGARLMYGVGGLIWGVATLATAAVQGVGGLLALRFVLGAGEAPQYPSCIKATTEWFPDRERGAATGIWDMGARVGGVLTIPLVTAIIGWAGWRAAFLVAGVIGLVWALGWLLEYRSPDRHRRPNDAERAYIRAGRPPEAGDASAQRVTWRALFRYRAVWGMMIGYFCFNYVAYFFITWFPSYLVDARHFNLLTLGIFGMIPGLAAVISEFTSGFVQDALINRGRDKSRVRKTFLVVGMLCASLVAVAVVVPTAAAALALLTFSYAALLVGGPTLGTLPAEFAPSGRHVGALAGVQNFAGNIAGFLGPIITGAVITATGDYLIALVLTGAIALAGALNYVFVVPRLGRRHPAPAVADATA
jgi:ACS family glucarate transporter-like MFS transporter